MDWSVRFLAVPRPCVTSGFLLLLHQCRYTSFFPFPSVYLSLFRLFDEALHLRHRCISELLLCLLSSWPLSAIYGSSEVTFLIIIPTGRSLTRTQPSSCALVTYGSRVTNPRAAWSMISHSKEPIANRTS